MARLFNNQPIRGVVVVPDGTTIYNGQPVIGVRSVGTGVLFSEMRRAIGVEVVADGTEIHNDWPVLGVVGVPAGETIHNGLPVEPASGALPDVGIGALAYISPEDGVFASNGVLHPFSDLVDFSRSGGAFQQHAGGDLVALDADVPRLADYSSGSRAWLKEGAATNLIDGAPQMVTQTQAVSAVEQTLAFSGTGSITLSGAHSATLSGTGATDRVSLTFTPSAGSLTFSVSGDVRYPMMQAGPYASSPVVGPAGSARAEETADVILAPYAGQLDNFWALIDFNHLAEGTGFDRIWQFGGNTDRWSLEYWSGAGELRFYQYAGNSPASLIGYATMPGVRHRVAMRMGNGTVRMFVDGTDAGSDTAAGLDTPTSSWIGGSSAGGNVPAVMKIYDAIISATITETEAQAWTAA